MKSNLIFIALVYLSLNIASCIAQNDTSTSTISPSFETYAEKKCIIQGLMCKNCDTLVKCVQEEGGLAEYVVEKCNTTAGDYCYRDSECNSKFNPTCSITNYTFLCTATGVFPDPFDCKKYYYCVKSNETFLKYDYSCGSNWTYNMITTYCDIHQESCPFEEDKFPCPICETAGQSGPLENKSIWYLCTDKNGTLIPDLHLCANGMWYDEKNGLCKEKDSVEPTKAPGPVVSQILDDN